LNKDLPQSRGIHAAVAFVLGATCVPLVKSTLFQRRPLRSRRRRQIYPLGEPVNARNSKRPQYSLRTVFAIVVLLGMILASVGNVVHNARVQRSAISDIRSVGGRAYYPYQSMESFDESAPKLVIRSLFGSEYVYSVIQINLNGTRVSDRNVQALSRLRALERLNLSQTAVSDTALKTLPRLHGLEEVNVEATSVSDAGMVYLSQCQQLRYLWLRDTQITDNSVQLIVQLSALKKLDIRGTAITPGGVVRLLDARPDVEIYHESQPEALRMLPKSMQRPIANRPTMNAR